MRFEELGCDIGEAAVSLPFHPRLTVVGDLAPAARAALVERILAVLEGTAAGAGSTLTLGDSTGRRLRLAGDATDRPTVTNLDTGEDITAEFAAPDGRIDTFARLGLDHQAAAGIVRVGSCLFDGPEDVDVPDEQSTSPAAAELTEARAALAVIESELDGALRVSQEVDELRRRVDELDGHIRHRDEEVARRAHGAAVRTVRRLEEELALLGGTPAERAAATLAAADAVHPWRRTGETLAKVAATFGDRRRLDAPSLERALAVPTDTPAGLDGLHEAYTALTRRRSDLLAAVAAGTASELPAPSTSWIPTLAAAAHLDLWARAERVKAARSRAVELSMGLGGTGQHRDLVKELEVAHQAVEMAERAVAAARVKPLAVAARRRLAKAQEYEHDVLTRSGFVSWLSFQMRRIDVLLEPDALEALRGAELDTQVALSAWSEQVPDVDPERALEARAEVEAYAAELADRASSIEATEAMRAELAETVEPAWENARLALVEVIAPFGVEPEHAVTEVAAAALEARLAVLQVVVEAAEADHAETAALLDEALAAAGLPGPGELARRVAVVTERAPEATARLAALASYRPADAIEDDLAAARALLTPLARPDWDANPSTSDEPLAEEEALVDERAEAVAEAGRLERGLPDSARLAERQTALAQRVAALEAACGISPKRLAFEEAKLALLGRFAAARRVGPDQETLPLLLEDPFSGMDRHEKWQLLELLIRFGEGSQVVYLTDDVEVSDWAAGRARDGSVGLAFPEAVTTVA